MSLQPADILSAISVNNSEFISISNRNNRKLAKSDFTKLVRKAKKSNFPTSNAR